MSPQYFCSEAFDMARLSAGTLAVAVVAVLLALTGAFAVRQFLEQRDVAQGTDTDSSKSEPDVVTIPIAVTDLEHGRVIRESDFTPITMSRDKFVKSEFAKRMFIDKVEHLTGRVLRESIVAGATVGPVELYSEGTGPTVAEKLPAGMRAVTVKVNGSGFADGFAAPGTFVDVLFRSTPTDSSTIPETTITALTRIEVLAVDVSPYPKGLSEIKGDADTQEARVTFAVVPSEATMIKALEDRGEISLALRPLVETPQAIVQAGQETESQERHAQTVLKILEGVKATPVAIATTELVEGRVIRAGDIRLIDGDKVDSELDAIATYTDAAELVGRVLKSDIAPGQVIAAEFLYPEGVGPGVADRLAPGFRAVTVRMDKASLVDGFVSPGTHVDVFFRAEALEGFPETTLRVLEGLQVLAIEDRISAGVGADDNQEKQGVRVTMAVPLGDVGRIQALEGHGTMTLVVRAENERSIGEIARQLKDTQSELARTEKQIAAFKQISEVDGSITLSKEQRERLVALQNERPRLERQIDLLNDERDAATSGASQTTLAEVLNLPEPSRPATLEIYNGGSRETLVFNSGTRVTPSASTASRGAIKSEDVKSTSVDKRKPVDNVKNAVGSKSDDDVDKVTLVSPGQKVSTLNQSRWSSKSFSVDSRRRPHSILTSFSEFGKSLVAGLNKATETESRVEIVRGGVRE
jgi:Flp pilus assembly protein CpaB